MNELIPNTGNYKKLLTYQKANVIYQITYYFCHKFLIRGDRTVDQMIQPHAAANKILWKDAQQLLLRRKQKSNS